VNRIIDNAPAHRIHQREIADLAGVSISTVSRVLNNVAGISGEAQQRVLAAANTLGYPLHLPELEGKLDQVMLLGSMGLYGPGTDPFYAGVVEGIEAECRRKGISLSFGMFQPGLGGARVLEGIKQQRTGLILIAVDDVKFIEQALHDELAVITVNADHPDVLLDQILPDNRFASERAVRYLIEHGHRRILHLTFPGRLTIQRRHAGYRAALEAADIPYDPSLVIHTPMNVAPGYEAVKTYVAQHGHDFTAIFCANDFTAIGAMSALHELGLHVPDDVSMIGYDDIPVAALLSPPLTTMRIDRQELGTLAVRRLLERAAEPTRTPVRIEVAGKLVERQSVAHVEQ